MKWFSKNTTEIPTPTADQVQSIRSAIIAEQDRKERRDEDMRERKKQRDRFEAAFPMGAIRLMSGIKCTVVGREFVPYSCGWTDDTDYNGDPRFVYPVAVTFRYVDQNGIIRSFTITRSEIDHLVQDWVTMVGYDWGLRDGVDCATPANDANINSKRSNKR